MTRDRMTARDSMLLSCDYRGRFYLDRMKQEAIVEQASHDARKLRLGTDNFSEEVFMSFHDAFRAVIMAMTGSGKTFVIRRILDVWVLSRSKRTGMGNCAFVVDMKDEYKSSRKPVQSKFRDKLPDNEAPTGHDMFVCRPTFFKCLDNGELPKGNHWVSIDMKDVDMTDFQMYVGFDTFSDRQKGEFKNAWELMRAGDEISIGALKTVCGQNGYTKLWERLRFVETSRLFDPKYVIDPVELIRHAPILILNLADNDSLDIDDNSADQIFLNVWYKKLKAARKKALIGQLLMVIDEARLLVPAKGNPLSKKMILKSVKEGRMSGISYIFGIQDRSDVPEKEILTQCQHWFLPNNMKEEDFRELIRWHQLFPGQMLGIGNKGYQKILQGLAKPHRWLYIPVADKGAVSLVDFYPPVSWHMEMVE